MAYQRLLAPENSLSGAYRELKHACAQGRFVRQAPMWLSRIERANDGYVLLAGELAALPVRRGRIIACLANPLRGVG